jgi:hypothetical protein
MHVVGTATGVYGRVLRLRLLRKGNGVGRREVQGVPGMRHVDRTSAERPDCSTILMLRFPATKPRRVHNLPVHLTRPSPSFFPSIHKHRLDRSHSHPTWPRYHAPSPVSSLLRVTPLDSPPAPTLPSAHQHTSPVCPPRTALPGGRAPPPSRPHRTTQRSPNLSTSSRTGRPLSSKAISRARESCTSKASR